MRYFLLFILFCGMAAPLRAADVNGDEANNESPSVLSDALLDPAIHLIPDQSENDPVTSVLSRSDRKRTTRDADEDKDNVVDVPLREKSDLNMWRSVGSLFLIVGALFIVSKLVQKRLPHTLLGKGSSGRMMIEDRLSLDTKSQLVLIRVEGRKLVVAVAGGQVSRISEWPVPDNDRAEDIPDEDEVTG